jgi:acetyl-CoA carboxylase biotin carboxyl carrier protein
MADKTHDQDVAFIQALAELLRENDLTELHVKREYGEMDSINVRVSRMGGPPSSPAPPAPAPPPFPPRRRAPAAAPPEDPAQMEGAVTSPMVGTVYLQPEPGAKAFVSVGDKVVGGPDAPDRGSDEDHEPDPQPPRRHRQAHPRRGQVGRGIRRAADDHRVRRAGDVQEDPDRQPRRDRAARRARRPRDGRGHRRRPFHGRCRRDACAHGRRGDLHRPAALLGQLSQHGRRSCRPPRSPARRRSTPATASCPRTPISCRRSRITASSSSAPRRSISA